VNNSLAVRRVLSAARRQWWVVLQAMVIIGALAGWTASKAPLKPFQTQAGFLVKAVASDGTAQVGDLRTYYLAQARILKGENVAAAVAAAPAVAAFALTPQQVSAMASLSIDPTEGSVTVFVKGEQPDLVVAVANAYGPAFDTVVTTDRVTALNARAAELSKSVADAKAAYEANITDIANAKAVGVDTGTLEADRNFNLQQYSTLSGQNEQLKNLIAAQPKVVEILESAGGAARPAKPSVPLRTAIGGAVGLMLGLGLASLREMLDDKLRDSEAAAETAGVPTIAELPRSSRRLDGTLPVIAEPNKGLAESIRSLRTTVRFLGVTEPVRAVAITSAAPGDGKSLVAANLAAAFALAGTRTILVSGDLRRPSIDPIFSASSEIGLSDLLLALEQNHRELNGSDSSYSVPLVSAEDYLVDTAVANLRLLPAGTPCPNPAELLGSMRMPGIIKELVTVADMVIIDCPPTLVADAVVLAKLSDGALLVTSMNRSRKRGIRSAVEQLGASRANLLGVVVNRASAERRSKYGQYASTYAPQKVTTAKSYQPSGARRSDES